MYVCTVYMYVCMHIVCIYVCMSIYVPRHLCADAAGGIAVSTEVDHLDHSLVEAARAVEAVQGQCESVHTEGPEVSRRNGVPVIHWTTVPQGATDLQARGLPVPAALRARVRLRRAKQSQYGIPRWGDRSGASLQ